MNDFTLCKLCDHRRVQTYKQDIYKNQATKVGVAFAIKKT